MNSRALISFLAVLVALLAYPSSVPAADRFWVGNGNWSATANWSASSGGAGGATVPGTSDRAVFDANSGDCTVNANVNCGGWLLSSYPGTITVGDAFTVLVQTSFSQDSGTIVCGTNLFTFYNHNPNFTGGTFTPNPNGWVRFQNAGVAGGYTISGGPTLENVHFHTSGGGGAYPWAIAAGSTVTVNRTLLTDSTSGGRNRLDTGTIRVLGNVTNLTGDAAASAILLLDGNGDQTLHGTATAFFPHLVINKPSGVLTLSGTIRTARNWTHLAGDINPGVSTVILYPHSTYGSGITSTTARATFHNLSFDQYLGGGWGYYYDLHGDMTLVVSNTLSFGQANLGRGGTLRYGSIEAFGNIDIYERYASSTTLLKVIGTGSHTMTGYKAANDSMPPHVIIDKPSGTLTLAGTFSLHNNWTHLSGDVNPGTSYVWMFARTTPVVTLTSTVGRVNFYDVRMDQAQGGGINYYIDLAADTTMVISNRLMFDPYTAGAGFQVRNSRIEVYGDVINDCDDVRGTTLLRLTGSSDHSISTFSPFTQLALNMEVDKSDGIFSLATPLIFNVANKDFTVKAGTFNLSTNKFTLSANGADFRMTNSAVLMTTVNAVTNGMVTVTGTGIARVDGDLFVTVPEGYTPNPNRTNVIITAASGGLVQNTPFTRELATANHRYDAYYNIGGNRVYITNLRFQPGGSVFMIR